MHVEVVGVSDKGQGKLMNLCFLSIVNNCNCHCVKSVSIRSYSGPHFPAFGLNAERYSNTQIFSPNDKDQNNSGYGLSLRGVLMDFF